MLLRLDEDVTLSIGRLGAGAFPAGAYLYVGSAHGPGGLRARLAHHARLAVAPHWHIDWLRRQAWIAGVWWAETAEALECRWVQALLALAGATIPLAGFGSSDCVNGCPAHLIFFGTMVEQFIWRRTLEEIHSRLSDLTVGGGLHHCPGPIHQEHRPPDIGNR